MSDESDLDLDAEPAVEPVEPVEATEPAPELAPAAKARTPKRLPPPQIDDGPKNRPLGEKTWAKMRSAYIIGGLHSTEIAARYGVHEQTVRRRSAKEGWLAERKRLAGMGGQLLAGRWLDPPPVPYAPGDEKNAHADTSDALRRHTRITDRYLAIVEAAMEEVLTLPPNRAKAEAIRNIGESLSRAISLSRDVRGIRPGEASVEDESTRTTLRVVVSADPVLAKASGS